MLWRVLSFVGIVSIIAASRLLPHPPNFSPFLAIALFSGAKLRSRWIAYGLPVAALWLSDFLIGTHNLMAVVAAALVAASMIGELSEAAFEEYQLPARLAGWGFSGLLASIVFFLMTNLGVWLVSGMYPHTTEGLWTCYVVALPFFHNQVLSTWLFSALIFSVAAATRAMANSSSQAAH